MTADWSAPAWVVLTTLGTLVLLALGALLMAAHGRRAAARAEAAITTARIESEALRTQVQAIEERLGASVGETVGFEEREYVITRLGELAEDDDADHANAPAPRVDGPLFADLVLRESVVQAASLAAGLRRALAPEHLNRIRFEMRREVKRARKQRRVDARQARREFDARRRATDRAGEAAA